MPKYETFREEASAHILARALTARGRDPLVLAGKPDQYGRVTHFVIWFPVRTR
jgi:hypothetical protein